MRPIDADGRWPVLVRSFRGKRSFNLWRKPLSWALCSSLTLFPDGPWRGQDVLRHLYRSGDGVLSHRERQDNTRRYWPQFRLTLTRTPPPVTVYFISSGTSGHARIMASGEFFILTDGPASQQPRSAMAHGWCRQSPRAGGRGRERTAPLPGAQDRSVSMK